MFELNNEQRKCFGLKLISDKWICNEIKQSRYDNFKTFVFIDGDIIVKCIIIGDNYYSEYELFEKINDNRKYLLPKTTKGKPVLLTSSSVQKRNGVGMRLNYYKEHIHLFNELSGCSYYHNSCLSDDICDFTGFEKWVEKWCSETTDADITDINHFSQQKRKHVQYNEGDVFRFKIGRRLYGYGRILLDYDKMRKAKISFWDILMCKPIVCSVYHIVTERDDVSAAELKNLLSLPSTIIADNPLYFGEYEIIGNIPITVNEDYPIMYGQSINVLENAVCYQCGKTYKKIDNGIALYKNFRNNGVSFNLNFTLEILNQCIDDNSNEPYWNLYHTSHVDPDLRNPKFKNELAAVRMQMKV